MQSLKRYLFIILLLAFNLPGKAQSPIEFTGNLVGKYIGKQVEVYTDSSRQLNFAQVRASRHFKSNFKDVPDFGTTPYNHWIRFQVVNRTNRSRLVLNLANPSINSVDVYLVKGQKVDSVHFSEARPIAERAYQHQFFIVDIPVAQGESGICYLKVNSNTQVLVPLTLNTADSILPALSTSDTLSGLYLGIMLVMLVYNLFIYFSARDKHYLYYVNYIFWVALAQATLLGYSHKFLWTDNAWLASHMLTFTGAMSGIASVIFVRSFLHTKHFTPRIHPLLSIIIVGDLIAITLLLAGFPLNAYKTVNVTAGLGSLFVMFVAVLVYKENYKPARYFLFAWSVFLGSVIVFVLKDYGVLPYNLFTIHSVQIGSALEAVLLSFALADKINMLKKEKEESQAQALRVAQENEKIIREQNVVLETKVSERTAELKASNVELNRTLQELKDAQTQLVESEKMASLGQLTAGIAHEINNPINFVTSNVAPLKRDVDMLMEVIDKLEEVGLSAESLEEKRRQIEEHKEELDFDYLKIEIDHLLKGIHEGASRTAEIVKGLRIFSRVDEDDLKKADINEGLDSTLIIINNLLNNRIKIFKEYGNLPLIECFPGKLNQVFLNIITNAIHAIKSRYGDDPEGWLKISTSRDENNVFVKIEDNGTGMDEKTKKKIFEPFFTTKEVGEGTGLGMSIAFNTIKKHNGQIHLRSEPGVGTEFILELPIVHELVVN